MTKKGSGKISGFVIIRSMLFHITTYILSSFLFFMTNKDKKK